MRKQRSKTQRNNKRAGSVGASAPQAQKAADPSKRATLQTIGGWGLISAAVVGVGYWGVSSVTASITEGQLDRIGNGTPAVVQIHDPQCPICAQLMRQTRTALADLDDGELTYLVANIKSRDGAALANAHGVAHVTLLLFDGAGNRVHTISGVTQAAELRPVFKRLADGKL